MSTPTQCCDMGSDRYAYPVYDMFGIVDPNMQNEGTSDPVVVSIVMNYLVIAAAIKSLFWDIVATTARGLVTLIALNIVACARDEVGLSSVVQLMSIDVVIGEEFGSWRKRTKEDTRSCRSTKEDELRLCDIFVDRLLFSKARSRLELLRKARGRRQVAREDDRGVTEGREVVRKVFQQHGSRAKRKLSRYGRNQIGNEPILALPKGADDFVVYCDTRSKDLKACLEKGRRCINEQDMESNLEFDFKPLPSGKGNVEVVPWSREEKSEAKNEFEIDVGTLSIEERIRQSNDYPCLERYDVCVVLRGKANSLAVGFGLWKLVEIMLPRLFVCQGTVDVGPRVMIKSVYESIIESSLGFESVVLAYFGTKDQM
ncbi:hypothetical protein Tco_0762695 [Tanacetum coccineum]